MAKATILCKCEFCGKEFYKTNYFHNRQEADNWETLAKGEYKKCPACCAKEQGDKAVAKASEYPLPEIVGKSEKQINYALSLRARYVSKHETDIKRAQSILAKFNEKSQEDRQKFAEACNLPQDAGDDAILTEVFKHYHMPYAYLCLSESDAGIIIDALKY